MRFRSISMPLFAFCLGLLAVRSFGELVMIREKPVREGDPYRLTCVAEDHRAALVWNDDLRHPIQPEISDTVSITSPIPPRCALAGEDYCRAYWKKMGDWPIVNSVDYPMGPVFDYRWKEFSEHSFTRNDLKYDYQSVINVSQSGTVVFSARVLGDINVQLCEEGIPSSENSCFRITIPTWPNKTLCFWETTQDRKGHQKKCFKATEYAKLSPQSDNNISEWRTFTLTWDKNRSEIISNDAGVTVQEQFDVPINVNHLFVQSTDVGRIRFHFYDYLLTQTQGAKSSFEFYVEEKYSCLELMASLCIGCELEIRVVDDFGYRMITKTKNQNHYFTYDKLPTWQVFILDLSKGRKYNHWITLEIVAIFNQRGIQGRWAIDSLRTCESAGALKISKNISPKLRTATSSSWPTIGCQQLSYGRITVVSSKALTTRKIPDDPRICKRGQEGPACAFNCTDSCKGTSICDKSECVCAPGFEGSDCTECSDGRHGFDCEETCGHCKSGICNKINGYCGDCEDYYLSPYCKTRLSPGLEAPVSLNFTSTTVSLKYQLDVEGVQKISFQLKRGTGQWHTFRPIAKKSGTTWICKSFFTCLSPGTPYSVQALVKIRGAVVKSPETSFTTNNQLPILVRNLGVISQGHGDVALTWNGPQIPEFWELRRFTVVIEPLNTTLRNDNRSESTHSIYYWVDQYEPNYGMILHLLTSSVYRLRVIALTSCGNQDHIRSHDVLVNYRVPASPGFASEEKLEVNRTETFIILKLPSVINDTTSTRMIIVVKGWPTCTTSPMSDDLKKLANMSKSDEGWIAVIFEASDIRPAQWTIGKDSKGDSPENCPLHPEQTYVVMVVVVDLVDKVSAVITSLPIYPATIESRKINSADKSFNSIEPEKSNLYWLVILFILLICFVLLFMWRRKMFKALRQVRQWDIVSYSQVLTSFVKSATTCTSAQPPSLPVSAEAETFDIESTFEIVTWNRYSHSVNIQDFEDYVKESIAKGLLKSQFQMIPRGMHKPCKYGALPENKFKNRYSDIIPYDKSRVILKKTPGDAYSDYINANYIQGFRKKKAYIATQGPKPQTVVDFWRMVWQEEALTICMLANVVEGQKPKCEQYWPECGASITYGDIVIVTETHRVLADYTFRTFRVSCKEETREIEHLHYTGWPDHTVPRFTKSIITYLKKLRTISNETGPIIVHCSAGVGRTGTIILLDMCLRRAFTKGTIDVLAAFKKLRDCRLNMVDNELQYVFVHVVLAECLVSVSTELDCNHYLPMTIEKLRKNLPEDIEGLRDTAWRDQALRPQRSSRTPLPEQLAKNRFPELAPVTADSSLVFLERYPTYERNSDYISAVIVDGLKTEKQYLASQLPLPSTLSDFWRLIAGQRIELVIMLQQPDLSDPTCCQIFQDGKPFNPVPFLNVELKTSTDSGEYPKITKVVLTDTSGATGIRSQEITFLTCPQWGLGKNGNPPPPEELIALWMSSWNIHQKEGPTLVLCHDGITGCGLYLALSFLLERMAVERKCDIIFAVRAIRLSRPNFVQSQEQFEYLYDAAVKYVESFEMFTNFV